MPFLPCVPTPTPAANVFDEDVDADALATARTTRGGDARRERTTTRGVPSAGASSITSQERRAVRGEKWTDLKSKLGTGWGAESRVSG
jgi:hypothetical protein